MDCVIAGLDLQRAAAHVEVSNRVVIVIFRMDTILVGRNTDFAVCNPDGIVRFQAVRLANDVDRPAGDLQIVLTSHAIV